jgi:hypothetical protein
MSVFDTLDESKEYAAKKEIPKIDIVDDSVRSIEVREDI